MDVNKLQFFDNNGYNLNFKKSEYGYWEGNIYLPKVSVGLYANTTIYILEEVDNSSLYYNNENFNTPNEINSSLFNNSFVFPVGTGSITFNWDVLNKFVDEFFMFTFDESYILKETSALAYAPNDGPECETLIINRFDTCEIPLEENYLSKALPIHIAFMANEKSDATTYMRTLVMSYNGDTIARINFYAETVEEDERLKIWNDNLGYNITPEDEMIFKTSDIKEYKPNYILLNEKRKELMMEGSNIYPYIGSYKAIINAIKFFGYENLNIIEYWRNVNKNDENFGKIYHSSKYSLTNKETLRIGSSNIVLPNKDYKKINQLALVYSINKPTGEVDEWELPKVKEEFTYTIEEALIKLFALRKKLNKEFMPGTSRIIDIIGEANYFGIKGLTKINSESALNLSGDELKLNFDVIPGKYVHITNNSSFCKYILSQDSDSDIPLQNKSLSDIISTNVNTIYNEQISGNKEIWLTNKNVCEYYKDYCNIYNIFDESYIDSFDTGDSDSDSDSDEDITSNFSAKVVLSNTSFDPITFGDCECKFNTIFNKFNNSGPIIKGYNNFSPETMDITFENIDVYHYYKTISWKITMSSDQIDEEYRNIGIEKKYDYKPFEVSVNNESISEYNDFFVELPYIGYYDVTMAIGDIKKTKKKCIKVEPYNIELIGFYYDARELPDRLKYDMDDEMYNFIKEHIENMYNWAVSERTSHPMLNDFSMPTYSIDGGYINKSPYYISNVDNEWYLSDNLTYEITDLTPVVRNARYIRNGVDVKPYTWFLLGFEYSKIVGKKIDGISTPKWTITNNSTYDEPITYIGKYLTFLLKKEGNYTITLTLEDSLGNKYETSRNIIVVSKSANYNIYQTFKKEYDYYTEQEILKELNDFYFSDKMNVDIP